MNYKEIVGNQRFGLYDPKYEHDNCGIGAVVNIKGKATHQIVKNALQIVETLEHRAGKDADGKTGDGVGILLQISHKFFKKEAKKIGVTLGEKREYGIGMFFFPSDELKRIQSQKMFEIIVKKQGLKFLGWRTVPVEPEILGQKAVDCMPYIAQAFIEKPVDVATGLEFDRMLYIARRIFEHSDDSTYVCSLSSRTIVYKGMFLVSDLRLFFHDLQDSDYESAIATVHSRFSTNTNPSWERAHPNRFIVHNGEINTIKGNVDKMMSREERLESEALSEELHKILPVVERDGSDSAQLDNTLEFLVMSGMDLPLAVMITIPEPWDNNKAMSIEKKDFYHYYATMMEPWDGPASILFSDGDLLGAVLDRNGLRPSRYYITADDTLILSSEVGVLDTKIENVVKKERLHPGKMLLVDTVKGRVIDDEELKESYATKHAYGQWLDKNLVPLNTLRIPNERVYEYSEEELLRLQKAFGYTYEDVNKGILALALTGSEEITSMGVDTPIPVLSAQKQPLFNYFKQMFAQVTNPPMDAIREEIVTSTTVYVGADNNPLDTSFKDHPILKVNNPILTNLDLLKIKNMKVKGFKVQTVPTTYYKTMALDKAIDQLFVMVDKAYKDGANIIILSDRGIDENHMAIPSLLAVSSLQQYLVRTKRRTLVAMILESGEPREVHHFATLLGYGASAVNPYLAQESIRYLIDESLLDKDYYAAVDDYNNGILHGIVKIASKMGISTIGSYQGSQIFEAVGVDEAVTEKYFTGTTSRIGGINLKDIEEELKELHTSAFDPLDLDMDLSLSSVGNHKYISNGEEHLYNPMTISLLQRATRENNYSMFKEYTKLMNTEGNIGTIRGLFDFNYAEKAIPIEEVESAASIVKRFKTGAMSYGSISGEAHEALAIAMNTIGGKSNSGEGGESLERLYTAKGEQNRCSAIKQVASGRFGVTSEYLVSAKELQIKMAQGAKPGEGGHLPGEKVYPWIADTRHSTTGVTLISPPPHHDIYSIEDLAELIYDLKNANRQSRISVKLVAEAGVGTIAAGVAKAGAEVILISGYDGGTGAAPISSIHNAGIPWELGLAETHQTLIMNDLRDKVVIETDGKLMSGKDVAIAAMLGAEEFGFATAPLVSLGCVMMRVCNLDTCPVGIATQNPELRKRFKGKPEYVINFMMFIAEELREYMALLGVRTLSELVGRSDLLKKRENIVNKKARKVDLARILDTTFATDNKIFNPDKRFDFELDKTADISVLLREFKKQLPKGEHKEISMHVTNLDRSFGTIFGSEITRLHQNNLEDDTFVVHCTGSGGQSFGAFIPKGLTLDLTGESNDYLGKGLSGGKLIVTTPKEAKFNQNENIIIGNVALYGATSGSAYINGIVGERFCIRNSGATAVCEGVGDHGLEYMTGGKVAILGKVGKNFAAGMSGGVAYVLDEHFDLYKTLNKEMVAMEEMTGDTSELRELIQSHVAHTASVKGQEILDNFEEYLPKFKKIIPINYRIMMKRIATLQGKGLSKKQAEIEAFYMSTKG
ncbi:glutamate synthase large subunit [Chakrabartyella piscis]|uniref:glutamate synthase large subunit n=1 Tax=Chakrabartyella piscis TaxID=2918914 RepID=UPI002958DABC|nr:glutamate synthase large subunit [Chakrabartyella piscis]